ncbi:PepSY domain-containing protein [Streptomyces coeruleorubidus]|uniref:PepSY domain-containing protein n=1 Tax=Streptomyces coeruleorubidus TaxID=116188 RepID=UPI00237F3C1D|nr:PepSY domain-containing protein [Streptomyces coeruleorubidus]WDV49656.1 PepSY domain-containing protein [Streptomyces coeruleorubidus]
MRKTKVFTLLGGGLLLSVTTGAALAAAGQEGQEPQGRQATVRAASPAGFEIEIDPELDAQFGPRPVNAVQAAGIVTDSRPGARVLKVELDEEGGRAVWEVEAHDGAGDVEALVDAFTGQIVGQDAEDLDEAGRD